MPIGSLPRRALLALLISSCLIVAFQVFFLTSFVNFSPERASTKIFVQIIGLRTADTNITVILPENQINDDKITDLQRAIFDRYSFLLDSHVADFDIMVYGTEGNVLRNWDLLPESSPENPVRVVLPTSTFDPNPKEASEREKEVDVPVANHRAEETKRLGAPGRMTEGAAELETEEAKRVASHKAEEVKRGAEREKEEDQRVANNKAEKLGAAGDMEGGPEHETEETKRAADHKKEEAKRVAEREKEEDERAVDDKAEKTKRLGTAGDMEGGHETEEAKRVAEHKIEEGKRAAQREKVEDERAADDEAQKTKQLGDAAHKREGDAVLETEEAASHEAQEAKRAEEDERADDKAEKTKRLGAASDMEGRHETEEAKRAAEREKEEDERAADDEKTKGFEAVVHKREGDAVLETEEAASHEEGKRAAEREKEDDEKTKGFEAVAHKREGEVKGAAEREKEDERVADDKAEKTKRLGAAGDMKGGPEHETEEARRAAEREKEEDKRATDDEKTKGIGDADRKREGNAVLETEENKRVADHKTEEAKRAAERDDERAADDKAEKTKRQSLGAGRKTERGEAEEAKPATGNKVEIGQHGADKPVMGLFDVVVVISSERRKEHLERMRSRLHAVRIPSFMLCEDIDPSTHAALQDFKKQVNKWWAGQTQGPHLKTAAALAKLRTWHYCFHQLLSRGFQRILLLEDDVHFHRHFGRLLAIQERAGNLYLGEDRPCFYLGANFHGSQRQGETFSRPSGPVPTFAMGLHSSFLQLVTSQIGTVPPVRVEQLPLDLKIQHKAIVLFPMLIVHESEVNRDPMNFPNTVDSKTASLKANVEMLRSEKRRIPEDDYGWEGWVSMTRAPRCPPELQRSQSRLWLSSTADKSAHTWAGTCKSLAPVQTHPLTPEQRLMLYSGANLWNGTLGILPRRIPYSLENLQHAHKYHEVPNMRLRHGELLDCLDPPRLFADDWFLVYLHDNIGTSRVTTMVKSGVAGDPNSVLLPINFEYHVRGVSDALCDARPYTAKTDAVVWRGVSTGPSTGPRAWFVQHYAHLSSSGDINVGLTRTLPYGQWETDSSWLKPPMTLDEQLSYRYILVLEGNDVATNLKWALASNSVPFMPPPQVRSWFLEDLLIPWIHYVPLEHKVGDLEAKIALCRNRSEFCSQIAQNGRVWIEMFRDQDLQRKICREVAQVFVDAMRWHRDCNTAKLPSAKLPIVSEAEHSKSPALPKNAVPRRKNIGPVPGLPRCTPSQMHTLSGEKLKAWRNAEVEGAREAAVLHDSNSPARVVCTGPHKCPPLGTDGRDWPDIRRALSFRHAQDCEDLRLFTQFFFKRRGGFYVELGGLDGSKWSTTYLAQAQFGWSGILIEGSPSLFQDLKRNRPGDHVVNKAVCGKAQTVHFVSNNEVGGIIEFMTATHLKKWYPNWLDQQGRPVPQLVAENTREVECVPLAEILAQAGVVHVDYFSLDVEGAELSVVATFPFSTVGVSVWSIEMKDEDHQTQIIQLLEDNGYVFLGYESGRNGWFQHKSFTPFAIPDNTILNFNENGITE